MRCSICMLVAGALAVAGGTGCVEWPGVCHGDDECGPCERCLDGACQLDERLLNACGECAAQPAEVCYDGLDNDCDGLTDEACDPCGNGEPDPGETCDGDCPADCDDADPCTEDSMTGKPEDCDVACHHREITDCVDDDGCCPEGCDRYTDTDCDLCGNDTVDEGETCDGDCPADCDDADPCTEDSMTGTPDHCDVECHHQLVTDCVDDDGCCPEGCDRYTDTDCDLCGNDRVDEGETCDGDCPADCDDADPCTEDSMTGTPEDCDVACHHQEVVDCISGDGCCPAGCTTADDEDCFRPSWMKTWGGEGDDVFVSARPDGAGGWVVAGQTASWGQGGLYDLWLVALDGGGYPFWQTACGGEGKDFVDQLVPVGGGWLAAGHCATYTTHWDDQRAVRFDEAGGVVWQTVLGSEDEEYAYTAMEAPDGGVILAGRTANNWGNSKALFTHLDTDGNLDWHRIYGGTGEIYVHVFSVLAAPGGGIFAAGAHYEGAAWDALAMELDADGSLLWSRAYGGEAWDGAVAACEADGGWLLAGVVRSYGAGAADVWLLRIDAAGDVLWQKALGGPADESAVALAPVPAGGFILSADTTSFPDQSSRGAIWLVRLDADGEILWQKCYGGARETTAGDVLPVEGGGFLAVGGTEVLGAGGADGLVMRLDEQGDIQGDCPQEFIVPTQATVTTTEATLRAPTLNPITFGIVEEDIGFAAGATTADPVEHCP